MGKAIFTDSGIKHVWFDFAGTLYKETPEFNKVHDALRYKTFAEAKGIPNDQTAKEEFLDAYKRHGSNSAVFVSLGKPAMYWSKALDNMDFSQLLSPDLEVINTLTELKERLPISLFTNFIRPRVHELLGYLGIPDDYFTHILTGDMITERKPSLEGFYKMIELSGVPANQIMYIGDRPDVDIKPAKQVGMVTCLIYGGTDEADYNLKSFSELQHF
jgi:putative hydrolase of the HAD superfamily